MNNPNDYAGLYDDNADAWYHQMDLDRRYQEEQLARQFTKETPMKFPAKTSVDFTPAPAGNHVGICTGVVDLGLQPGSDTFPDPKHQVYLRFELPQELVKDSEGNMAPMMMGRTFTASMNEKSNLRKLIESWFGKQFTTDTAAAAFDVQQLLGKRGLLNVTHTERDGKVRAKITTITPLPKGMTSTEAQHNASVYYSLDTSTPADLARLPEWLQKKIQTRLAQPAAVKAHTPVAEADPFDGDIPL